MHPPFVQFPTEVYRLDFGANEAGNEILIENDANDLVDGQNSSQPVICGTGESHFVRVVFLVLVPGGQRRFLQPVNIL